MATQIVNNDPRATNTVSLEPSKGMSRVLSSVAVGDVVRFSVRQNPNQGRGLINIGGNLVKATLPEHLSTGDNLLAKVSSLDSQLLLQILELQKAGNIPGGSSLRVALQLSSYLQTSGGIGIRGHQPFMLPPALHELAANSQVLQKLFTSLGSTENLFDSNITLGQLLSATNGELAMALKDSATVIRSAVDNALLPASERLLQALQESLSRILEEGAQNNQSAARQLFQLSDTLARELKSNKSATGKEKALLQELVRDLNSANENPEMLQAKIDTILAKLHLGVTTKNVARSDIDPSSMGKLLQVSTRLEQMAATQETLNQLNPLMQALGEPALILFPFLFQGLIAHTEVTVDSNPGDKKGQGKGKGKSSKRGKTQEESYQRIHINVPLPSMGSVGVEIAHRSKEILIRFSVADEGVGEFVSGHFEELASILRKQGFQTTDLTTTVGAVQENAPHWSSGLPTKMSFVA